MPGETETARVECLRHEAELIAEAEREFAEGKGIAGDEFECFFAWFISGGPPPAGV